MKDRIPAQMKRLLVPLTVGLGAARHLAWYVNYQMTGETRADRADRE